MITLGASSSRDPAQGLGHALIIAPLKATRLLMAKSVLISAPNEARSQLENYSRFKIFIFLGKIRILLNFGRFFTILKRS